MANDATQADNPDRAESLRQWRLACTINDMLFVPLDGICWACGGDLVAYYIAKNGLAKPTGCPLCHRSFVE